MSQMKPVKPLPNKEEVAIQPTIVIFPDPKTKGHFLAQSQLPERETAQVLSNLALSFAIQAGMVDAYKEATQKIINPNTGKLAIQGN